MTGVGLDFLSSLMKDGRHNSSLNRFVYDYSEKM